MKNTLSDTWDNVWNLRKDPVFFLKENEVVDRWDKCHFKKIDEYLKKLSVNSKFLEAGCGLGQWCFYASRKYKLLSTGVDIAPRVIIRAQEIANKNKIKNVNFLKVDLFKKELKPDYYDFFISLGAIEHSLNYSLMLQNLFYTTKPKGRGLITVPNIFSLHTITRPILKFIKRWNIGFEKSFSVPDLKRNVELVGFKVIECGILPSEELFGSFLRKLPIFGEGFRKLSLFIERNQKTFGFISYVLVEKQ